MKASTKNMLLLGGFFLFVLIYWLVQNPEPDAAAVVVPAVGDVQDNADSGGLSTLRAGSKETLTPSADNVDHSFRVQVARLKQRVEEAPRDTASLGELGRLLQDAHQMEEAVKYYKQYLEVSAENVQIWLDLATGYATLEEWDEALKVTKDLLKLRPEHPAAMYNLGAIYANRGNFEEAAAWWQKVKDQTADADLATRAMHSLLQIQKSP